MSKKTNKPRGRPPKHPRGSAATVSISNMPKLTWARMVDTVRKRHETVAEFVGAAIEAAIEDDMED